MDSLKLTDREPTYYSIRDAARESGLSVGTMFQWSAKKRYRWFLKIGKRVLIHRGEFLGWIEAQRVTPPAGNPDPAGGRQ